MSKKAKQKTDNDDGPVLKRGRFSIQPDVTVVVGGTEFQESSHALRICSEYFDAALRSGMKESISKRFEFPDKDPKEWELVRSFFEPFSNAEITATNAHKILPWFDKLGIHKGIERCDPVLSTRRYRCRNGKDFDLLLATLLNSIQYNLDNTTPVCLKQIKAEFESPKGFLCADMVGILFDALKANKTQELPWDICEDYVPSKVTDPADQDVLIRTGVLLKHLLLSKWKNER
ncbi:expressed unknown protein [Seminavis robusta]|uniref:BTB domain-containing protein n=1 Tax=Seminavis robusta TaxID=568900 RepID=A0A9N8DNX2_9STRA|nr:expressed unknown protein [Seminavis robusta]|eukprot:Sro267_g103400.1 n/a (232) ;mRNA; r:35029-35724